MSSFKHTPAPWFVGDCEDSDYYIVCTELYKNLAMGQAIVKTHDEANARLIAAAPELLEALQNIVAIENTEKNEWNAVEVLIPKMCEIARKAIAKATG